MKKLLIALLLTAGMLNAHGQKPNDAIDTPAAPITNKTVDVYGIIDTAYIGSSYRGVQTNPNVKQTTNSFGTSGESASRLGIKGSEDLGGGKSAFYTVETNIQVTNGTVSTWNNRQSFLGLKQSGLGQVSIGTQYTPITSILAVTDAGQLNGMPGDLIWTVNPQANLNNTGSGPFASASSSSGASAGYTIRTSNMLAAKSETFNGFQAQGFYTLNGATTTQNTAVVNGVPTTTGGTTNFSGYGGGLTYVYDKLLLGAAYQSFKSQNPGTATTPTPSMWTTTEGGVNMQDNQTYLAATYDFGIVKTYAQWINRKGTNVINSSLFANRTAQQIGVRGNFTSNIDGWFSIGNGNVKAYGTGQPTANFVGYNTGVNYWLSKRTNLYAVYGQNQSSSVDKIPGVSASAYGLGMRHTF